MNLCSTHLSEALRIATSCTVKNAHHIGAPSNKRHTLHPLIVRYLNYSNRVAALKSFWNAHTLQLDGHKLMLSADYSQVSWKQKVFQQICLALHLKGVHFTLAYPAALRLTYHSGETKYSPHPEGAASYHQTFLHITQKICPMEASSQHSTCKDPPKRTCYSDDSRSPKPC